jgi:hypothetical protein
MRTIFISTIVSWALFFMILAILDEPSSPAARWFPILVVAIGLLSWTLIVVWRRRPLNATSPSTVSAGFQRIAMVGYALAETPVLLGFIGFFVTGELWVYLIGVPFGLVGFRLAGPTAANLRRWQGQLRSGGLSIRLVETLSSSAPPTPRD